MPERLQKLLAQAGYGSRRACEEFITAGRVRVNGQVATLGQKADLTVDKVTMDGKPTSFADLTKTLNHRAALNPNYPVYIQGQKDATHASMIYVLDLVKRAGMQKVAFSVKVAEPNSR